MCKTIISLAIASLFLGGCASSAYIAEKADANMKEAVMDAAKRQPRRPVVEMTDHLSKTKASEIEVEDDRNTISMSVSNANFFSLIQGLAKRAGMGTAVLDGVDTSRRVNVEINGLTVEQALRHIAYLAGYAAVMNPNDKTVTIADSASYTFRVPPNLLQKLSATYSVGGNPVSGGQSSGSSSGSGMSGSSGAAQAAPIKAEFTISGSTGTSPAGLVAFFKQMAGKNADAQVFMEQGLISVRGNGQALKRISDFIQAYVSDAMRQVEVQASIVEVSVNNDFRYGIKWDKVLNAAGSKKVTLDTTSSLGTATPLISMNYTPAAITSVLQALETFANVRVVSQPSAVALNHTPATLADVNQIPYLPSVQSTTTGTSATTTVTGTGAYAVDGVSFSFTADILDNNTAQITLVPVTTNVGDLVSFLNGSVQMPLQSTKQANMQVLVQNGRTVILGGNRHAKGNRTDSGIPGVVRVPVIGDVLSGKSYQDEVREHVILMRVQILPAPRYNPLVAEAI